MNLRLNPEKSIEMLFEYFTAIFARTWEHSLIIKNS